KNYLFFFLVFFFQAEDGIRDRTVTGVQTCALPISSASALSRIVFTSAAESADPGVGATKSPNSGVPVPLVAAITHVPPAAVPVRSEERRVGKECRSRWSPNQEKEKQSRY